MISNEVDCTSWVVYSVVPQHKFLSIVDMGRFSEWMAHETFAETRRRIFVKTPQLKALLEEMDDFANTSLDEPTAPMHHNDVDETFSFSKLLRGKR